MLILRKLLPILASILYVISPIDVVPDFLLPGVGWLDDLLVVGFLLWYMSRQAQPGAPRGTCSAERMQGRRRASTGRAASRGPHRRLRPDGPLRPARRSSPQASPEEIKTRVQAGGDPLPPGQGRPPRQGVPGARPPRSCSPSSRPTRPCRERDVELKPLVLNRHPTGVRPVARVPPDSTGGAGVIAGGLDQFQGTNTLAKLLAMPDDSTILTAGRMTRAMAHVAAYVTGHGFGHATRMAAIVGALVERVPDLQVTIVSTAPEWLFRLNLAAPFSYRARALDVGVVQEDSIRLDAKATLEAYARAARRSGRARRGGGGRSCAGAQVHLVVADIPAAAFPIARRAGVPGVGISNFSWDWIYAAYVGSIRRMPGRRGDPGRVRPG